MQRALPVVSLTQIGSGVPQTRFREIAQSMTPFSQLPNRPCLMCSGTQSTCSFAATTSSTNSVTRTNQDGTAR